ncbi:GvpL/GvpF family gas vesicle protein [Sphaerisporangium aureirubrum]|uniref:GvpL/GvpF family gas vesicle protein n=1 Tax=Sphaerisporangium aureirubrum TaxID=1544736 RepID=A0ABW1NW06_9ACTN
MPRPDTRSGATQARDTTSRKKASHDTAPRGTAEDDTAPNDTAPRETAAGDAAREKTAPEASGGARESGGTAQATATYLYGIVPGDVELTPERRGVGDPPGMTGLVRHGEIAALISDLSLGRALGRPQDLVAHQGLLDDVAGEVPVLPMRFGAVLESPEAIVEELLKPHHDEFLAALAELEGRAQFVVKGRYVEGTVLREVLREVPEAAELRESIRGVPEEASWDARIRLGEIVNQAIDAKRDADTRMLAEALAPHAVAVVVREPTHEEDAAHLAVLVDTDRQEEFDAALEAFADRWADRVTLRLIGPQAPYDFVTGRPDEAGG